MIGGGHWHDVLTVDWEGAAAGVEAEEGVGKSEICSAEHLFIFIFCLKCAKIV